MPGTMSYYRANTVGKAYNLLRLAYGHHKQASGKDFWRSEPEWDYMMDDFWAFCERAAQLRPQWHDAVAAVIHDSASTTKLPKFLEAIYDVLQESARGNEPWPRFSWPRLADFEQEESQS